MKLKNKLISSQRAMSIIKKPITTEKSTNLQQYNQYTFLVSKDSNAYEIKQAVEMLFKVDDVEWWNPPPCRPICNNGLINLFIFI